MQQDRAPAPDAPPPDAVAAPPPDGAPDGLPPSPAALRVAPLWLRLLAGLADLAVPAGLAAGATRLLWQAEPPVLPPRYWNAFDYAVDLFNGHPEVLWVPAAAFAAAYVLWETLWTSLAGAAPVARLLGIRVVTLEGRPAGPVRSFLRAVLSLAGAAALLAGPAWALVSPRRRMLHDILCRCLAAVGR